MDSPLKKNHIKNLDTLKKNFESIFTNLLKNHHSTNHQETNEKSKSVGHWWEITYENDNGKESFTDKGARWEIQAEPIFPKVGGDAYNLLIQDAATNMKEEVAGDSRIEKLKKELILSKIDLILDLLASLQNDNKDVMDLFQIYKDALTAFSEIEKIVTKVY
jgi:hypothetical protein